jgi:phosphatidate cytidylyltransferase
VVDRAAARPQSANGARITAAARVSMSDIPVSLPTVAAAASLCGALALAGFAGKHVRPRWVGRRFLPGRAGGDAWWLGLAGGAVALWLGAEAIVALFAMISAATLADFLESGETNASGRALRVLLCYLCVQMQYAFIAAGRDDLFSVCLPFVAALVIPLLTIAHGGTRALLERVAERYWGVTLWVYCVSHAPALLMLDLPKFAGGNAGLGAFHVVLALASQWLWSLTHGRGFRPDEAPASQTRPRAMRIVAVGLLGVLGALLAWMTPYTPLTAGAMALLIAVPGFLGCSVLAAIRRTHRLERTVRERGELASGMLRPDALAFAAPVFFYAVRAWGAW